eukprot:SAG31_NODE_2306_length_5969_cov_104.526065_5_plen_200_part_00
MFCVCTCVPLPPAVFSLLLPRSALCLLLLCPCCSPLSFSPCPPVLSLPFVSSVPPSALFGAAPPRVALSCVLRFLGCLCSVSNAFCLLYVSRLPALCFLACALLPLCCAMCRSPCCCLLLYACSAASVRPLLPSALYACILYRSFFSTCAGVSPCPCASCSLSFSACSLLATLFPSRVCFWCVPSLCLLSRLASLLPSF